MTLNVGCAIAAVLLSAVWLTLVGPWITRRAKARDREGKTLPWNWPNTWPLLREMILILALAVVLLALVEAVWGPLPPVDPYQMIGVLG